MLLFMDKNSQTSLLEDEAAIVQIYTPTRIGIKIIFKIDNVENNVRDLSYRILARYRITEVSIGKDNLLEKPLEFRKGLSSFGQTDHGIDFKFTISNTLKNELSYGILAKLLNEPPNDTSDIIENYNLESAKKNIIDTETILKIIEIVYPEINTEEIRLWYQL